MRLKELTSVHNLLDYADGGLSFEFIYITGYELSLNKLIFTVEQIDKRNYNTYSLRCKEFLICFSMIHKKFENMEIYFHNKLPHPDCDDSIIKITGFNLDLPSGFISFNNRVKENK